MADGLRNWAKGALHRVLLNPRVRQIAEHLPFFRRAQEGLQRTHPFDETYGVDTSGTFPTDLFQAHAAQGPVHAYIAFPPSIARRTLSTLPDVRDYTFVEIGYGKSRCDFRFNPATDSDLIPATVPI